MSQIGNNTSQECDVMKKVNLRMKELDKYKVIKELVDHKGNKKRAANRLGLTVRQINRLIKIYKEKGKPRICTRQPIKETSQDLG